MVGRLIGGLASGLGDGLNGGLIGRLVYEFIAGLVCGLICRLVSWLVDGLVDMLGGELICVLIGGLVFAGQAPTFGRGFAIQPRPLAGLNKHTQKSQFGHS